MNPIFKNTTVPEIIAGMESKFYTVFNRYDKTTNLNITMYNFDENLENDFFYKTIYGNSEYIVPASIIKLFSVNYFLSILDSNNLLEECRFVKHMRHSLMLKGFIAILLFFCC